MLSSTCFHSGLTSMSRFALCPGPFILKDSHKCQVLNLLLCKTTHIRDHSCTMWRLFAEIEHLQSRRLYFSEEQREGNKLEKHLYNLYIIYILYYLCNIVLDCRHLSPFVAICHRGYKRSSAAGYFFQNVLGCILMAAVARRAASCTRDIGTTWDNILQT